MCDLSHPSSHHFGLIVDVPEVRELIAKTERLSRRVSDVRARVERLREPFARLLAADGWLPEEYSVPDAKSGMGGGIG